MTELTAFVIGFVLMSVYLLSAKRVYDHISYRANHGIWELGPEDLFFVFLPLMNTVCALSSLVTGYKLEEDQFLKRFFNIK